jgi:hypothetical protein
VQAGLLSREMGKSGVPTPLELAEGNTEHGAIREPWSGPAVEEPGHVRNLHAREPGDPMAARPVDHRAGRSEKAEAARLRCTVMGSQTAP